MAQNTSLCPRCDLPLRPEQTTGGVFWGCGNCGGRGVTLELLRHMFTPASINPLWLHAIRGEGTPGDRCPSCRNAMTQVALSEKATVKVDVCRICHFVWFDPHEIETLTPQKSNDRSELPQKAREILAQARIEQIAKEAQGPDFDSAPPDEWWKSIAASFGIPVEFDAPALDRTAWITWILGTAIIIISALAFPNLQQVVQQFGLIPAQATRMSGLTFLTAFFLHGGILHLAGNIYFLLVFGDNVESVLRPIRYLILIALAAFVGDLAHIAVDPQSEIPSIGASGGIAGIITFYALEFPYVNLGILIRWYRWIRLPAWSVLVLWVLFQAIGAFVQFTGFSPISAVAHLGGAATGLAAWWIWGMRRDGLPSPEA